MSPVIKESTASITDADWENLTQHDPSPEADDEAGLSDSGEYLWGDSTTFGIKPDINQTLQGLGNNDTFFYAMEYVPDYIVGLKKRDPENFDRIMDVMSKQINLAGSVLLASRNNFTEEGCYFTSRDRKSAEYLILKLIEEGSNAQYLSAASVLKSVFASETPFVVEEKKKIIRLISDALADEVINSLAGSNDVYDSLSSFVAGNFDEFLASLENVERDFRANQKVDLSLDLRTFLCLMDLFEKDRLNNVQEKQLKQFLKSSPGFACSMFMEASANRNREMLTGLFEYIAESEDQDKKWTAEFETGLDMSRPNVILTLFYSGLPELSGLANTYILDTLQNAGYSKSQTKRIIEHWKNASSTDSNIPLLNYPSISEINTRKIQELELARPGICKTLTHEFGITNFGRYPVDMLIAQYDQRNLDLPYILISEPEKDHSGAFYAQEQFFEKFNFALGIFNKTRSENKYVIRVIEVNNIPTELGFVPSSIDGDEINEISNRRLSFNRRQLALDKRYGKKHKISHMLFVGHSDGKDITLGPYDKPGFSVNMSHVGHRNTSGVARFYDKDAMIIFDSCSTGSEGNFAQAVSEKLGVWTAGPETPGHLHNINIVERNGKMMLVPEFHDTQGHDITKIYFKGREIIPD